MEKYKRIVNKEAQHLLFFNINFIIFIGTLVKKSPHQWGVDHRQATLEGHIKLELHPPERKNIPSRCQRCQIMWQRDALSLRWQMLFTLHASQVPLLWFGEPDILHAGQSFVGDGDCDGVDLHAEKDSKGVAYQPGHAEPKQGQPLLSTRTKFSKVLSHRRIIQMECFLKSRRFSQLEPSSMIKTLSAIFS